MFIVPNLNKIYHSKLHNYKRIIVFFLLITGIVFSSQSQTTQNSVRKIVIDPGHGGKDSGTMGTKRYKKYEKDIALSISIKLGLYIAQNFPQIDIIYTRKSDIFLELKERTELANKTDADLFISIHCDGFTSPSASGASVFVMGMSKLKANMDVAMRENSVIYMEDNYKEKYEGFDPQTAESYIVFSLMQNTFLEQSISFAEDVENEFSSRAKRKSRGVKQAPFYVISRVNMPSVLIETGFLTNPEEEDYLHTVKGQDFIASAIFRAFRSYKERIDKATLRLTEIQKIEEQASKDNIEVKEIVSDKDIKKEEIKPNIIYKVQIGTYLKEMMNTDKFKDLTLEETFNNGTYKYSIGNTSSKDEADRLKKIMREKGFNGAFVIAFSDGIRINVKEALSLQNK